MRRVLLLLALASLALPAGAVPISWGGNYPSGGACGITHVYGIGTAKPEIVPPNCTSVVITLDGGGGGGGCQFSSLAGGGGGSGDVVKTIAVVGDDTFLYTVGQGGSSVDCPASGGNGATTRVSGTVAGGSVTLGAGGGAGALGFAGGSGGVATGGDSNTNGSAGAAGGSGGAGGTAGSGATAGQYPGGGGNGGDSSTEGGSYGVSGQVTFAYS